MILRLIDLDYLARIDRTIAKGGKIAKKSDHPYPDEGMMFCPECDSMIDYYDDRDHLIINASDADHAFIAICCEGYHPLDI